MLMSGRTVMPGRLHVHQEVGDAAVLGRVRVGAGEHEHPVGVVRAGGPDLLAVDDVVVAVADGAGLERGEVGAGARLASSPGTSCTSPLRICGRCSLLLLLGAVDDERRAEHAECPCRRRSGARGLGDLLVEDELLHRRRGRRRRTPSASAGAIQPLAGELLAPLAPWGPCARAPALASSARLHRVAAAPP